MTSSQRSRRVRSRTLGHRRRLAAGLAAVKQQYRASMAPPLLSPGLGAPWAERRSTIELFGLAKRGSVGRARGAIDDEVLHTFAVVSARPKRRCRDTATLRPDLATRITITAPTDHDAAVWNDTLARLRHALVSSRRHPT